MKTKRTIAIVLGSVGLFAAGAALVGSRPTDHAALPSSLGVTSRTSALEAVVDEPGPVTVETVVGADWAITRAGLINLKHPAAVAAGLTDGDEPIQVMFHAIHHPTRGLYLVDTGVERALQDDPEHAAVHGLFARAAHMDKMIVRTATSSWLAGRPEAPAGVFLTHLHLDHVSGMRDVPDGAAVYAGRGETSGRNFMNFVVRPITDAELAGKGPVREWQFQPDPDGAFEAVLDVFGDASVWALHVPGHTRGSTAYLARTPEGPVLLVGDACHTAWGWEHGVEPGDFSEDKAKSAESLERLRRFVAHHPRIDVRLGHQALDHRGAPSTALAR